MQLVDPNSKESISEKTKILSNPSEEIMKENIIQVTKEESPSSNIVEFIDAIMVEKFNVKSIKNTLERLQLYDKTRRIHPSYTSDGHFVLPIVLMDRQSLPHEVITQTFFFEIP